MAAGLGSIAAAILYLNVGGGDIASGGAVGPRMADSSATSGGRTTALRNPERGAARVASEGQREVRSAPSSSCVVHARLVDDARGTAVSSGRVLVWVDGESSATPVAAAAVDASGTAVLTLDPGRYRFGADRESLPSRMAPPARQGGRPTSSTKYFREVDSPLAELRVGEALKVVEIPVFRTARIYGTVASAEGSGLARVLVRATAATRLRPSFAEEAPSGPTGAYELEVLPGVYVVRLVGTETGGSLRSPLPRLAVVAVGPGEDVLVDHRFPAGDSGIVGHVFDPPALSGEQELRYGDLQVRVVAVADPGDVGVELVPSMLRDTVALTATDERGEFAFEGLPAGDYELDFGRYEYSNIEPLGRLGADIHAIQVTLDGRSTVDLGGVMVPRARPCRVVGAVRGRLPPMASQFEIEIDFPANSFHSWPVNLARVSLDDSYRFACDVHTSPDGGPARLRWRRKGESGWAGQRDLALVPDGMVVADIELD